MSKVKYAVGAGIVAVVCVAFGTGYLVKEYDRYKKSDEYDASYDEEIGHHTLKYSDYLGKKQKERYEKAKAKKAAKAKNVDPAEAEHPEE